MTEHSFILADIRRDELNDNDDIEAVELECLELMLPAPSPLSDILPHERLEQALPILDLESEDVWQDLLGLIECYVINGNTKSVKQVLDFIEDAEKIGMLYGQHQLEKQIGLSSTAAWLGDYAIHNEDLPMLELLYERGLLVLDYGQSASGAVIHSDETVTNYGAPYLHAVALVGQPKVVAWMLSKPEIDTTITNENGETIRSVCEDAIKKLEKKRQEFRDLWPELDDLSESRKCGEEIVLIGRRIEGIRESMELIRASGDASKEQ